MSKGVTYDLYKQEVGQNEYIIGNYNNRGKKWMRNAHVAIFDADGKILLNQNGYIGVSGGTSSAYAVKSLKVTMFVDDEQFGHKAERTFKLRSGSQDQNSGNIRSSLVSRLSEESGFDGGTTTERVVVFLNGDFYGIFDLQDTFSEVNMARKYGIVKQNKIKKYKGAEKAVFEMMGIDEEIWINLDTDEGRDNLESVVDVENYLLYYAIQILLNNTDWPMNNYGAWRYDGKKEEGNIYTDGRVRFLQYDTDLIYYIDENMHWADWTVGNIFQYIMEKKYAGKESVFPMLMESEYYRGRFIDVLRRLLDGPFRTENVLKIIDEEAAKIDHQVELWSTAEEYEEWKYWIDVLRGAAAKREQEVRDDVLKYFGVIL